MRYFVVVPIVPDSDICIVLESQPTRKLANEAAKRRKASASKGSIHKFCRVLGRS